MRPQPLIAVRDVERCGGTVIRGSPADFGSASDTDEWAKVIKSAGVKLT